MITIIEVILWIVAGIVISEIIFIVWGKNNKKLDEYSFFKIDSWILRKLISLVISLFFIFIHLGVLCDFRKIEDIHYEYLLYELLIIIGIVLLFGINYLINKKITKE